MQHPSQSPAPMAAIPSMITTEQIQKFLDENKQLILAILDSQNLGKLSECAQYQAQLQKNLLFLAAIADAQPQAAGVRPQMMPHGTMPQGGHYMQQQQQSFFPARPSLLFNPQQMQEQQQQQQQQSSHHQPQGMPFPGQIGIRPGAINGMHNMHVEPSHGGNADLHSGSMVNANDAASEPAAAHGKRSLGAEHGSGDASHTQMRRAEDGKTKP